MPGTEAMARRQRQRLAVGLAGLAVLVETGDLVEITWASVGVILPAPLTAPVVALTVLVELGDLEAQPMVAMEGTRRPPRLVPTVGTAARLAQQPRMLRPTAGSSRATAQ